MAIYQKFNDFFVASRRFNGLNAPLMINSRSAPNWHLQPVDRLKVTAVSAFTDNYIWLIHSPTHPQQVVAVDPGDSQAVMTALQKMQLKLAAILITHHHTDHVGGVLELLEHHEVPVFGPVGEAIPGNPNQVTKDQPPDLAEFGLEFEVLNIPGHTKGHIAYSGHGSLFCGDTLFSAGCGRLFEGTAQQMTQSLSRLSQLPPATQVYCAHEYTLANLSFALVAEPDNQDIHQHLIVAQKLRDQNLPTLPSTIDLELKINPFLRLHNATIKRAASDYRGKTLEDESEIFCALRDWKNNFKPSPISISTRPLGR